MNDRVTSDSGNSVSLFPFLAVLLCTMGALLVLLVVLAQRAGQRVVAEVTPEPTVTASSAQPAPADFAAEAELEDQIAEVQLVQQRLDELRKRADGRLREEQQRLTHVEQHTRRLEHELARLSLAAEQLKATEHHQTVDQEQAENELVRLHQLIVETESDLKELREQKQGQRSYAIVPYRGPNGTFRKPVYIECRGDGIVLHPEGIRLESSDFLATSWAGNPLAAALRATRDHVNVQAAKAGAPEPPDPYPMLLVRPDGIRQYSLARAAIKSWDAHYGYEFIDADWELNFPELPDPQLARIQQHAILLSRQRLARLIRSAPSRFAAMGRGRGLGGSGDSARGGDAGFAPSGPGGSSTSGGFGESSGQYGSGYRQGESQLGDQEGEFVIGAAGAVDSSSDGSRARRGQWPTSEQTGSSSSSQGRDAASGLAGGASEASPGANEGGNDWGAEGGAKGGDATYQAGSGAGGSGSSSTAASAAAGAQQAAAGRGSADSRGASSRAGQAGRPSRRRSAGNGSRAGEPAPSIAETQGRNWALPGDKLGAVAMRRPIQVVVRQNQLALLPSRHVVNRAAATGKVISLNQSPQEISTEFVSAMRRRIDEWGLAGNGLYWQPVLNLNVGPGAEQAAQQVLRLLKNSGVEVRLPETARAGRRGKLEGAADATR